jgi:uncharacterized protein YdaT
MKFESMIFELIAASVSKSQKGDVSKYLLEQGFFDQNALPIGLKRDNFWSKSNPIDTLKLFNEQNLFKGD